MNQLNEGIWYLNFDWSMIWTCLLGVIVHILYLLRVRRNSEMKMKVIDYLFYIFSSFLVLTFVNEVGLPLLKHWVKLPVEIEGNISHFLSALCGLGGAYVATLIIKMFSKK